MTGVQLAIILGAVVGIGLAGLVYYLVPAQPDLGDVVDRLAPPARRRPGAVAPTVAPGMEERMGMWAERTLPARLLGIPPARDLAVMRQTPAQFYGRKVLYALLGLAVPPLLGTFFTLIGIHVPLVIPFGASLVLAAVLFVMPSRDLAAQAKEARSNFARALSAYIELCALERNSGAGASVALATAAEVGDSWMFAKIGEEIARSRYNGQPPWDALNALADDLALPELADVADIMRLASDESSEVYRQLRARSASARSALLSEELARASLVEERMYFPASILGLVFLALLMAPPLLRLLDAS
ncbi:hypothetical protein LG324_12980 [Phycicoccus jejuensis]|uniref:hypothetical protein n=1 Tax=Phycicoccus jejuensis TaxID=367299 RepID=UPI00384B03AF